MFEVIARGVVHILVSPSYPSGGSENHMTNREQRRAANRHRSSPLPTVCQEPCLSVNSRVEYLTDRDQDAQFARENPRGEGYFDQAPDREPVPGKRHDALCASMFVHTLS